MTKKAIFFFENRIKETKDLNERIRLSVILGRFNGHPIKTIASILRISISTVYEYLNDFDQNEKIKNKIQSGRTPKLSEAQEAELQAFIKSFSYKSLKALCTHIQDKYNILYTTSGIRDWLKRKNLQKKIKKKLIIRKLP